MSPRLFLGVALLATLFCSGWLFLFVYSSLALSADIGQVERIRELARAGVIDVNRLNERIARDGGSYTVNLDGAGWIVATRDYFIPSRTDYVIWTGGIAVVVSLGASVCVAVAWLAVGRASGAPSAARS